MFTVFRLPTNPSSTVWHISFTHVQVSRLEYNRYMIINLKYSAHACLQWTANSVVQTGEKERSTFPELEMNKRKQICNMQSDL